MNSTYRLAASQGGQNVSIGGADIWTTIDSGRSSDMSLTRSAWRTMYAPLCLPRPYLRRSQLDLTVSSPLLPCRTSPHWPFYCSFWYGSDPRLPRRARSSSNTAAGAHRSVSKCNRCDRAVSIPRHCRWRRRPCFLHGPTPPRDASKDTGQRAGSPRAQMDAPGRC